MSVSSVASDSTSHGIAPRITAVVGRQRSTSRAMIETCPACGRDLGRLEQYRCPDRTCGKDLVGVTGAANTASRSGGR